jgi:hypothetical protein
MSQQNNDSGGGLLLFAIHKFGDWRTNKKIAKQNELTKGVVKYQNITADMLFPPQSCQENIVISGGSPNDRLKFSEQLIENNISYKRAMIALHLGNSALESLVSRKSSGVAVSRSNKLFDGFTSFNLQEICQIVFDTHKSKYDIKPAGRYILQIVHELLSAQKIRPYFCNFVNFTYHQIPERINDCLMRGLITQDKANELNSLLMMGQSECPKIDTFFYDMAAQVSHIATANANSTGGTSVLSAIKKGQILSIDLSSSANIMLVEFIVNTLTIAMNRGYEFSLFIDDVAISNNESLKNMLCHKASHNNIVCSKDLWALFTGKEDVFVSIVGEAEKAILLSHASHISCEKWAKYIGEYDRIEVNRNRSGGFSQSSRWGYNANVGQSTEKRREYKVKPEEINRLSSSEIIFYDNQSGTWGQTTIV